MKIPIYQVDAFTDVVFGGNPAAICPLDSWLDDMLMQNIASENNLSETAFFVSSEKGLGQYDLRWFTPSLEINLCGHATLATAHVLFNHLGEKAEKLTFSTRSGDLVVAMDERLISMDFPAWKANVIESPQALLDGLGINPKEVLSTRDILVILENEEEVRSVKPDFGILNTLDTLGVIISAPGKEADFVSRFFAPRAGVNEDPVTGSAHSTLVPYWAQKLGKTEFTALQLSKRGGKLLCSSNGDRVIIKGNAVTSMMGQIYL